MLHQDVATAPQDLAQRAQPPGNLSQHDFTAWLDALGHSLRIAQPTDALAPWQWGLIAALTLWAALAMEARWYRERGRRPLPGFRAGACMGLIVSASAVLALGWLAARSLVSGAIRCMSRAGESLNETAGRGPAVSCGLSSLREAQSVPAKA